MVAEETAEFALAGAVPAAEGDELPEEPGEDEIETYILSILYLYGDKSSHADTAVAPAWSAEISPLQDYAATIKSPDFPGYTPDRESIIFNYQPGELKNDVQYVVRYNPADVSYTVLHRWQNVDNDEYSDYEVVSLTGKTESLVPGNLGSNPDGSPRYEGLEPLPYAIDTIAADGTTLIEIRHDRIYYLMTFELGGGHGTYPIYARYETPLTVPDPIRPGYTFQGWDRLDENGNGDGVADALPALMPSHNSSYKALWTNADTTYSVAYWIVNEDGTTTYLGSRTAAGMSGTLVFGDHDDLGTKENGGYAICGSEAHTHTDACYICGIAGHAHTEDCFAGMTLASVPGTDNNRDAAIADLEGGAPESGYIYVIFNPDSNTYWPKLYLEDSNGNGQYYVVNGVQGGDTESSYSSIIEGEILKTKTGTYNGEKLTTTKYRPKTTCGTVQHIHGASCRVCEAHAHTAACYQDDKYLVDLDSITVEKDGEEVTYTTDTNVTIKGDGSSVVNVYYRYEEYTLKFYYAVSRDANSDGTDDTFTVVGGSTYYFGANAYSTTDKTDDQALIQQYTAGGLNNEIGNVKTLPQLNALGQARLDSGKYKLGSFSSGGYTYHYIYFNARYNDNISELWPCAVFDSVEVDFTPSGKYEGWTGTTAFVSAWNGEYQVKYTRDGSVNNGNQTIKGKYELLDENLLWWNSTVDGQTVHADPKETHDGSDGTIAYLCFWENGSNKDWSIPRLFRYNIWVQTLAGEIEYDADNNPVHKDGITPVKERDGVIYKRIDVYSTCDDSNVNQQTQPSLVGYDNNGKDSTALTGVTEVTDPETQFDRDVYVSGVNVNFYYLAHKHSLKFWNHSNWLGEGNGAGNSQEGDGVQFSTPLKVFGDYVNADFMAKPENYPKSLEKNAYVFAGWYTSPLCLPGTEMDWNSTMPDADVTVYAKWSPKIHTVHIYRYRNADGSFPTNPDDILREDLEVSHGTFIPEEAIPEKPSDTELYTFDGWFYLDENGVERAFDFYNIPVNHDLNIYAKWQSNQLRDVTIRYVTEVNGVDVEIAPSETFKGYVGDLKTYNAKTENQLYEPYRKNYYPETASSSITVNVDVNQNEIVFLYVYRASPPYTVEYWIENADGSLRPAFRKVGESYEFVGNTVIDESVMYTKRVENHGLSVVTEKALAASKYLPDQIQKRLILSADDSQNVIRFIYTYSPNSAIYTVNHYVVKPNVTTVTGPEDYDLVSYEELTGEVGSTVSANPTAVFGAEFSETDTVTQNPTTDGYTWDKTTSTLSAKVKEDSSTTLDFFYTRIECDYRVLYINKDTGAELGRKTDLTAQYGETVTEKARTFDGYMVDEENKSIVIQAGSAATNTITFYYTRKTGDIQISKTVKLDEAQVAENPNLVLPEGEEDREFKFTVLATDAFHKSEFSYTITRKDGTEEEGTVSVKPDSLFRELNPISLCSGDKVMIHGLSLGQYTVKETHVIGYKTTVGTEETEAKVITLQNNGDTVTVDFLNTYPFFTGDLILSKEIRKVDPSDPDGSNEIFTYTITVTPADGTLEEDRVIKFSDLDSEGNSFDSTFTVPAGGYGESYIFSLRLQAGTAVTVEDIPEGDIQVWETIDESHYATPYYEISYTKKNPGQDAAGNSSVVNSRIYGGHDTAVAYTNTYKKDALTIQKTVTQEYLHDNWQTDTFTFAVTGETQLPDGTYQILIGGAAATATVADGKVTLSSNPAITVTRSGAEAAWSADLEIENLPAGTYAVQEISAGRGLDAYKRDPETVTDLQLTGTNEEKAAAFTNTFKRGKGDLYLEKELVAATGFNQNELPKDTKFGFTVALSQDVPDDVTVQVSYDGGAAEAVTLHNGSLTVALMAGHNVTITGLPAGEYRITETTIPSFANEFALKDGGVWVKQPSTSTADGAMYLDVAVVTDRMTEVKCTNTYPIDRAELILQKLVTKEYDRDTLPEESFTFTVTLAEEDRSKYSYTVYDQNGDVYADDVATVEDNAFKITLSAGQYAVLPDMPVCGYTVSESADSQDYDISYQVYQTESGDRAATKVDTSGKVSASGSTGSVARTFAAGKTDTVVFTNQYKKQRTNLTIDRDDAADSEQVFVYEVKNSAGDIITVTVVGNGETTIHDLPYGDYTVTQKNDWSWRYEDASQQVTLSPENNREGQAAEVTFGGSASTQWLDGFSQLIRNIFSGGGAG